MTTVQPFSISFSTGMGISWPLPRPESFYLPDLRHKIFLKWQKSLWKCLSWNGGGLIFSLDHEVAVVARDNGKYPVNHGELHPYSLLILSLIKYTFEYIFGACWLFVIANPLKPSLHTSLMVVIVKPSRGEIVGLRETNLQLILLYTGNDYDHVRGRQFSKDPPPLDLEKPSWYIFV